MLLCAGAPIVSTELAVQRHPVERPRVVLDTNASLALFAYADPSCAALLAALREGRLQAVANLATRTEWLQVLAREALRLDDKRRSRAVQLFDALVTTIGTDPAAARAAVSLPRCRDRDDQMFLELARDAGALALYTRDRELLKLSRRTQRLAGFVVLRPEDGICTSEVHFVFTEPALRH